MGEHALGLGPRQHHGEALRPPGPCDPSHPVERLAQDGSVEEAEGVEGLVLRRCGHVPVAREVGEERDDLWLPHRRGVAGPALVVGVEETEAADPLAVRLLRRVAVVPEAAGLPDEVEQLGRTMRRHEAIEQAWEEGVSPIQTRRRPSCNPPGRVLCVGRACYILP